MLDVDLKASLVGLGLDKATSRARSSQRPRTASIPLLLVLIPDEPVDEDVAEGLSGVNLGGSLVGLHAEGEGWTSGSRVRTSHLSLTESTWFAVGDVGRVGTSLVGVLLKVVSGSSGKGWSILSRPFSKNRPVGDCDKTDFECIL